jgi:hypothetical protein
MSVSSISANSTVASSQQLPQARPPEAVEPRRVGPDHDGDADDRVGAGRQAKPVVNTSGQATGYLGNTKA